LTNSFRFVGFAMTQRSLALLLVAAVCFLSASCGELADDITLQGAGATFPAPLYERWFLEYYKHHPNVRVNYQAIGSGAGIRQFTEVLVNFGASDALMKPEEIEKAEAAARHKGNEGVQMLPMTAGSIVLAYNLDFERMPPFQPEFKDPEDPHRNFEKKVLYLSRDVYGRIFAGDIKFWDDDAIYKCQDSSKWPNGVVKLPHKEITVVHRAEGSGTTYVFTSHLDKVSPDWVKKVPQPGKSVGWPAGLGARGNDGVTALIKQTPGAIGYLEYGYAELAELPTAYLQNKAGAYVRAGPESGKAGLAGADLSKFPRLTVPDPPGQDAYPIVTYTWMILYKKYADPRVAAALKKVLTFCLEDGQKVSNELGYIPLPDEVRAKVLAAVEQIQP
jgi:phosphate transport system substrate-binding protein